MRFVWNNCCECEISLHHQFNTVQTALYIILWEEFNRAQVDAHNNNRKSPKFPSSAIFDHSISSFRIAFIIIISNFWLLSLLLLELLFRLFAEHFSLEMFYSYHVGRNAKTSIKHVVVYGAQPCIDTRAAQSIRAKVIEWWRLYIEQHVQRTLYNIKWNMV